MALPIRPATLLQTADGRAFIGASSVVAAGGFFHGAVQRLDDLSLGSRSLDFSCSVQAAGQATAFPDPESRKVDGKDVCIVVRPYSLNGELHVIPDPEKITSVAEIDRPMRRFELLQLWTFREGKPENAVSGYTVRTSSLGKEPRPGELPPLIAEGLATNGGWEGLAKVAGAKMRRRAQFLWLDGGLFVFLHPTSRENANNSEREAMGRLVRFDELSANAELELDRKYRKGGAAPGRYSILREPSKERFLYRLSGKGGNPVFCDEQGKVIVDADGRACDALRFKEVEGLVDTTDVLDPETLEYFCWSNPKPGNGSRKKGQGKRIQLGSTAATGKPATEAEQLAPHDEAVSSEPQSEPEKSDPHKGASEGGEQEQSETAQADSNG